MSDARKKVKLFCLNDSLEWKAEELRELFMAAPTKSTNPDPEVDWTKFSTKNTIDSAEIKQLRFDDLAALMPDKSEDDGEDHESDQKLSKFDDSDDESVNLVDDPSNRSDVIGDVERRIKWLMESGARSGDPSSQPDLGSTDVVIILGHSNVFNFGPLAIFDILEALLHPKAPSLVVFLGCCGGNPRYGPLAMLSQLPKWQNTVFSFFQRRVYVDELCSTVPVLGIQYYLHLQMPAADCGPLIIKRYIKYSFRCAYVDKRFDREYDSALFLNAKDELATAQKLLDMFTIPLSSSRGTTGQTFSWARNLVVRTSQQADGNWDMDVVESLDVSVEEIPFSCWQLALYHTFTAEKGGEDAINNFIASSTAELGKSWTKEEVIKMVEEKCKIELAKRKLNKIMELACKIQLIQVTDKTFELLRNSKWGDVDHLQFFVAMLQGYWGKNNYEKLREYATHHMMKLMKSITEQSDLHTYQLCCVGYCMFSPETYVVFPDNCTDMFDTFLHREMTLSTAITKEGYQATPVIPKLCTLNPLCTDAECELPWLDVFKLCKKDCGFVKIYNDKTSRTTFSMHSIQPDDCTDHTRPPQHPNGCHYEYTRADLIKVLESLQEHFFDPLCAHPKRLKIKVFSNTTNKKAGYMMCFYSAIVGINYVEMRVCEIPENNASDKTWEKVSRCRFIYQYYHEGQKLVGTLFFTDSHYGQDKIEREKIEAKLSKKIKSNIKQMT